MAGNPISRRNILPGLAAGAATAALTTVPADAEPFAMAAARRGRYSASAGPCKLWAGHTMSYQVFLPATKGAPSAPVSFRLSLRDGVTGKEILHHDFQVAPGTGREIQIGLNEDGSFTVDGQPVGGDVRAELVVIAIIAVLIGLLLPAVQKVRASATSSVTGRIGAEQTADYLLPFIEQDNLI